MPAARRRSPTTAYTSALSPDKKTRRCCHAWPTQTLRAAGNELWDWWIGHGNGSTVGLSVAVQLQSGLDLLGHLRQAGGVGQVDGLLSASNSIVEAAGGGIGSGEGVEIGHGSVVGELTDPLGQSHGARGIAALRRRERGQQPSQVVLDL